MGGIYTSKCHGGLAVLHLNGFTKDVRQALVHFGDCARAAMNANALSRGTFNSIPCTSKLFMTALRLSHS